MSEPLRLLQVEDSLHDAEPIGLALTNAGYNVDCERVVNASQMWAALTRQPWDLIVAKHRLPEFDALSALLLLRKSGQDIPFIVVSADIGEEHAVAMMRAGAQDYLLKNNLARLAPAVEREIRDVRSRRGRELAERALDESERRFTVQEATLERQTTLLHHRETMLREIHHRVKNNMQVMSSLLSLQSRAASNPETSNMLRESRHRIQSMALLHEILCQSDDLTVVDFTKYLRRMLEHLFLSFGVDKRQIRLETEMDQVGLELDTALPCGLLINEVISNSLKHGFPEGRTGEIRIQLRRQSATTVSLVIGDSGVGFPAGFDWEASRSLGLRLVRALAEQVHGDLQIRSESGTEVQLVFNTSSRDYPAEALGRASGAR